MGLSGRKYDTMVAMLMSETYKQGIPYNEETHETIELTCEAMAQGIKGKNDITAFVEAGKAEKRYENIWYLIIPDEFSDDQ